MDWAVPIVTFFAGMAANGLLEWFKARIDRQQTRKERADDFQRETLLELQEAMRTSIDRRAFYAFSDRRDLEKNLIAMSTPFSRIFVLFPRLKNDSLRADVAKFTDRFLALTDEDPRSGQKELHQSFGLISQQIGDELRKI
jgi:hypothetical protein